MIIMWIIAICYVMLGKDERKQTFQQRLDSLGRMFDYMEEYKNRPTVKPSPYDDMLRRRKFNEHKRRFRAEQQKRKRLWLGDR